MKVSSDVLRVYKSLHTWVGIVSGLVLFIGFYAGALTMFEAQLDRWASPPTERTHLSQVDSLVSQVLQQHVDAQKNVSVRFLQDDTVSVRWLVHNDEEAGHGPDLDAQYWQASLQDGGSLKAKPVVPSLLGDLIDLLHQTAGIPGMIGHEYLGVQVLGVAGALYFIALVSGVIILLPSLIKDFFMVRTGKNRKRFWLDAHNVIGITSLPFHLVIAFTVVVFAFHDMFYGSLQKVVYQNVPLFGVPVAVQQPTIFTPDQVLPVSALVAQVEQAAPTFKVTELLYMDIDGKRPMVRAAIYNPDHLVRGPLTDYVGIHPYTGQLVMTSSLPDQGNVWNDTVVHFFALHFGSFGGEWVRWLYFLLGLSGAFLFYSGNLLWIESRRKRQKRGQATPVQQRNTLWMASATVGVCLGSMAGVAVAIAASKWGQVWQVENINDFYLQCYYSVFLLSVVVSFYWGAARAAVPLLLSCAVACFLIPITSLWSWLWPASGLWMHTDAGSLAVDGTAAALALVFVYMAWRTYLRLKQSAGDSVWSLTSRLQRVKAEANSSQV